MADAPSESARRFAALPKLCGRSGGDRPAPPAPLPARVPSAAAARFAALPRMHGWVRLAPLDDRARRLAEGHFDLAKAAARRLRRLGDDAESEAVWAVVSLAARWAGDEAGFAEAVARRLANVHRRAWAARSVVRPARGRPAPRVRSLTAPDGLVMDVVDGRTLIIESEWDGPMLFCIAVTSAGINLPTGDRYYTPTGTWDADPGNGRKFNCISDAECFKDANLNDWPTARVVEVCRGSQYEPSNAIVPVPDGAVGASPTNGAAGRHAGVRP